MTPDLQAALETVKGGIAREAAAFRAESEAAHLRALTAEARVEALERALRHIADGDWDVMREAMEGEWFSEEVDAAIDRLKAENERLRAALLAVFIDPLASHGARALARETLEIPFIPFASPAEMLAALDGKEEG